MVYVPTHGLRLAAPATVARVSGPTEHRRVTIWSRRVFDALHRQVLVGSVAPRPMPRFRNLVSSQ